MSTPSLLNIPYLYKAGTLYSQIPESGAGDFTVSRTTTVANRSTRINSQGFIELVANNVPRLDYPVGGAVNGCPALLVEPAATNLYQQSEDFSNVYWTKINCVASGNLTIAPDGNLTADKLIMGNGINPSIADQSGITRPGTITSGTYRFSVFAKAAEFTGFRVRENAINGTFLDVNLTNGAITNPDVTQFINPLAENYGNGWYRISWTSPTITSLAKYTIRVGSTGDGVSGIFVWGAQVETGSVATSYIPTTLIGQTEGTFYFEGEANFAVTDLPSLNRSITNSVLLAKNVSNQVVAYVYYGGVFLPIFATASAITGPFKAALAYKQGSPGNTAFFVNGVQAGSTNAATWAFTAGLNDVIVRADSYIAGGKPYKVRALGVYPNRIPNTAAAGVLSLATLTAL
jgi:hypothetical protein